MAGAILVSGVVAAAVVAKKKKRLRDEEERLTNYNSDDLKDWEFKIVRSATDRFKNGEAVKKLRAEEAEAGWELVEKFDNARIRFKRRIECRARDEHLQIDPYRTNVGLSEGRLAAVILGIMAVAGVVAFVVFKVME